VLRCCKCTVANRLYTSLQAAVRCCLVYLHTATPSATVHQQLLWLVVNMWVQMLLMLAAPYQKTLVAVLCAAACSNHLRAADLLRCCQVWQLLETQTCFVCVKEIRQESVVLNACCVVLGLIAGQPVLHWGSLAHLDACICTATCVCMLQCIWLIRGCFRR
jgi:hypothetical protein